MSKHYAALARGGITWEVRVTDGDASASDPTLCKVANPGDAANIAAALNALAGLNPEAVAGLVEAAEYLVATDGMGFPQLEKALRELRGGQA